MGEMIVAQKHFGSISIIVLYLKLRQRNISRNAVVLNFFRCGAFKKAYETLRRTEQHPKV